MSAVTHRRRKAAGHPRLYFDAAEQDHLKALRGRGPHAAIWRNMLLDAEHDARQDPATDWIPPRSPDPCYENLYDRFWAMLSDAALLEHLAFAVAYGAAEPIASAASTRLLATARRWRPECDLRPDYGTAYATTRVLKAVAVAYDLLHERLSLDERREVRTTLADCAGRLATEWFRRADVSGPVGIEPERHSPHHAAVEWSAFGVVALSLLGEVDAAEAWVSMARAHFDTHLLDGAVTADGAQLEGTAFWASTVFSQLQFLLPLRRCTGVNLVARAAGGFDLRLALACYRPLRERTTEGQPWYGDSTGMSAILFAAAAELGDPALQRLALAEPTTGRIEIWPARTARRGEQLRFAPGGYAYAWCRPDVAAGSAPVPRPWTLPSVEETYLRTGWDADDIVVAIRSGRVSVHVGDRLVYADITPVRIVDVAASQQAGTGIYRYEPPGLATAADVVGRDGARQWARNAMDEAAASVSVLVDAERRTVRIRRADGVRRTWAWNPAARAGVTVRRGAVVAETADGHRPDLRAGYGLLDVVDTDPRSYPTMTVEPDGTGIEVEVAAWDPARLT